MLLILSKKIRKQESKGRTCSKDTDNQCFSKKKWYTNTHSAHNYGLPIDKMQTSVCMGSQPGGAPIPLEAQMTSRMFSTNGLSFSYKPLSHGNQNRHN